MKVRLILEIGDGCASTWHVWGPLLTFVGYRMACSALAAAQLQCAADRRCKLQEATLTEAHRLLSRALQLVEDLLDGRAPLLARHALLVAVEVCLARLQRAPRQLLAPCAGLELRKDICGAQHTPASTAVVPSFPTTHLLPTVTSHPCQPVAPLITEASKCSAL